ncbi:MAG: hypothetical protein ACPH5G_10115 [Pseudooceanicola atlanticus]
MAESSRQSKLWLASEKLVVKLAEELGNVVFQDLPSHAKKTIRAFRRSLREPSLRF